MNIKDRLLISSSVKGTIKDSVEFAKELDCGIEISRIPLYKNKNLSLADTIEQLKSDLEGFKNKVTLHAMFSDVNVSSSDWELREIAQKRCRQSFEVGKAIGAKTILFHTGNKGTKHYGSIKSFKQDFIKDFEKAGITAVIENVFETTPEYCLDLFNGVSSPNFKLAIDTGHVNLYAHNTEVIEWIKKYGNNLHHMHIHNNFRENDDHSNLLNGTLDFSVIFNELKEQNLSSNIVLEMFTEEDILKSINYINSLKL